MYNSQSNYCYSQSGSSGLNHDGQGRWWEQLSPNQVLTGPEVRSQQCITTDTTKTKKKKKSKCHGNRKLHNFKRKWRGRGLIEDEVQALVRTTEEQEPMEYHLRHDSQHQLNRTTKKRKRNRSTQQSMATSIKSISQLSVSQGPCKRRRQTTQGTFSIADSLSNVTQINVNLARYSKYLKMPRNLLIRSLETQLNYRLKKEDEQAYIIRRLQLIDEQFCVDRIQHLYQSYWNLGSSGLIWPVSVR